MRVLVCGGRDFDNIDAVFEKLDEIHAIKSITCIIEGGAKGADYLASRWSAYRNIPDHERFSADWALYGKAAGFIRNQKMIDKGRPDYFVAFPGGRGTADMVRRLRAAGIPGIIL